MESTSPSTTLTEITYEDRVALSCLLFDIFSTIDKGVLATAQGHHSPSGSIHNFDQNNNIEVSDASATSDQSDQSEYPRTLSMHMVLADSLQYLQLLTFGAIISIGARRYTFYELIVNLERFLDNRQRRRS